VPLAGRAGVPARQRIFAALTQVLVRCQAFVTLTASSGARAYYDEATATSKPLEKLSPGMSFDLTGFES
jgi:hypothetical protein